MYACIRLNMVIDKNYISPLLFDVLLCLLGCIRYTERPLHLQAAIFVVIMLITFANILDPDQNVGPDVDPNCLTL